MGSLIGAGRSPPLAARPRPRGLTLVEILVVIAIIAIGTAAAWTLWRGADPQGRRAAEAFAGAVAHAAQRAQWRHEDLGVSLGTDGWRFWRRESSSPAWVPVTDDPLLAPRALPDGHAFSSVVLAGRAIDPAAVVPFRATGRNHPATWQITGAGRRWRIDVDILQRVAVAPMP